MCLSDPREAGLLESTAASLGALRADERRRSPSLNPAAIGITTQRDTCTYDANGAVLDEARCTAVLLPFLVPSIRLPQIDKAGLPVASRSLIEPCNVTLDELEVRAAGAGRGVGWR